MENNAIPRLISYGPLSADNGCDTINLPTDFFINSYSNLQQILPILIYIQVNNILSLHFLTISYLDVFNLYAIDLCPLGSDSIIFLL